MKTIATLLVIFSVFLLLVSCSTEDMETPKPKPSLPTAVVKNNRIDAVMQRDSISKDGDEIDPPVRPKP